MKDKKTPGIYLLSLSIILVLKLYTKQADTEALQWILRPTACWTSILSGHPFIYEQGVGYINHSLRFIIAPTCAGLKFWMITSLMLSWSFLHRIEGPKRKLTWTLLCFPAALAATIFINGIRITLSIALPQILQTTKKGASLLTPAQLHTSIGTLVYFLSLLALYHLGDRITQKTKKEPSIKSRILPSLWYLIPVLALPFLSRLAYKDYKNLTHYELPILVICSSILLITILPTTIKHLSQHRPKANQ
ncbi:MAG: exosortase K [Lachnospiraceae bacterium]|nr:exosortase K [Lachnospiraceae bacterium]